MTEQPIGSSVRVAINLTQTASTVVWLTGLLFRQHSMVSGMELSTFARVANASSTGPHSLLSVAHARALLTETQSLIGILTKPFPPPCYIENTLFLGLCPALSDLYLTFGRNVRGTSSGLPCSGAERCGWLADYLLACTITACMVMGQTQTNNHSAPSLLGRVGETGL